MERLLNLPVPVVMVERKDFDTRLLYRSEYVRIEHGLDPVHYGVVAVMSLAMGLITPPYGLCLLLAAKIGDVTVLRAVPATAPFALVILGAIALVILVPSVALWLPGLVE